VILVCCLNELFARAFEYFILVTIFANCVALGVYTPYPESDSNELNAALVSFSLSFILIVLFYKVSHKTGPLIRSRVWV